MQAKASALATGDMGRARCLNALVQCELLLPSEPQYLRYAGWLYDYAGPQLVLCIPLIDLASATLDLLLILRIDVWAA
jgi:hypothetical protein